MATRIQIRRDTGTNWSSANPVLASGELGINLTTGQFKIGNGTTAWNSLNYFVGYLAGGNLDDLNDVTITSAANGDFLRWNGSAWINDAVNLSTDTVGDYVTSLVAGTGVSLADNSGEGSTPTISIGQSVGTADNVTFNDVTVSGVLSVDTNVLYVNPTTNKVGINSSSPSKELDILGGVNIYNDQAKNVDIFVENNPATSWGQLSIDETTVNMTAGNYGGNETSLVIDVDGNALLSGFNAEVGMYSTSGVFIDSFGSTYVPLTVHGFTGQSANLQEWKTSSLGGSAVANVSSTGQISASGGIVAKNIELDPYGAETYQTLAFDGTKFAPSYSPVVSYVRNAEATTLTVGTVVYLFGGNGDHASVKRADYSSDTTSSKTVGVVAANITASENGPVVTRGYVHGMDLSAYSVGDVLWLGATGAFTTTKPSAPNHLVFVGVVVRATNNGIMYVATQNGYEIEELHDVSISSPASGDFLKYNGTVWVNDPINLGTDTVGNYMSDVSAGTGISITHTPGEGSTATIAVNTGTIATVTYVDSVAAGINWHEATKYATTAVLSNSPAYDNGTLGVGATLTAGSNGTLSIDGSAVSANDRILVKNQTTATHNGIYVVTQAGDGSTPYILTRASDTNNSVAGQVKAGDAVFVSSGSTNANQGFVLTSEGTGTAKAHILGTDNLTYTQFTGTANIIAGAGLTKTGNSLDIGTASSSRIVVNADDIDLATVSQSDSTGTAGIAFVQSQTIDSYGRITGTVTADVRDATTSVKGVASFDTNSFTVSSGAVSIKATGVSNAQLANSSITIGSTSISLGATQTTITGLQNITTGSVYSNSVLLQRGGMGTYGYIQWETNNNSVAQLNWNPTASQSITIPNLSAFDSKYLAVTDSSSGLISANDLTGTTLNSTVVTSSLTSVGTISSGTWQGSTIGASYLPSASTSASGIVQLNNTNTSDLTSQAATANAVRELQIKFLMEVI